MKKSAYKIPKGGSFRTYFHGNRKTNGCSFRAMKRTTDRELCNAMGFPKEGQHEREL